MALLNAPVVEGRTWTRLASTTPGRLRLVGILTVVLGLAVGLVGYQSYSARAAALRDAKSDVAQLVLLQGIRTDLVAADAIATNAFLVGGLEPGQARADYVDRVAHASSDLVRARAGADPDAAQTLAEVNAGLTRYTGLIESARANNRQGFPVGVGYLKNASALLHSDVLDKLATVGERNSSAVQASLHRGGDVGFLLLLGAVLIALGATQLWLKRISRRIVNLGVAASTVLLVLAGASSLALFGAVNTTVNALDVTSYQTALHLSRARIEAFDAKANESLTLISRGSGSGYQDAYRVAYQRADTDLAEVETGAGVDDVRAALRAWDAAHLKIRTLDDAGQWDQAVALATARTLPGSSANTFAAFDDRSAEVLDAAAGAVHDQLLPPAALLDLGAVGAVLVGLAVALTSWLGLGVRLKEYK